MKGISIKGIAVGIIAMLVGDAISSMALAWALANGQPPTTLVLSTPFLLGSVVLGTVTTVLGGYIAARIAKGAPYKNSAAVGTLGILMGVFMAKNYPLWFSLVGFLSILPSALFGGFLARRAHGSL